MRRAASLVAARTVEGLAGPSTSGRRWAAAAASAAASDGGGGNATAAAAAAVAAATAAPSRFDPAAGGPSLADFIRAARARRPSPQPPPLSPPPPPASPSTPHHHHPRTFHLETYGCAANEADTEIVTSLLSGAGLVPAADAVAADVTLLMTCSIREKAEARVAARLVQLRSQRAAARPSRRAALRAARRGEGAAPPLPPPPLLGVLGCMAERVKGRLVDQGLADVVAGPDAYRGLPALVAAAADAKEAARARARAPAAAAAAAPPAAAPAPVVDTALSLTETYADVIPTRAPGAVSARLTISRGCDSHCAFCVVPHTRGAERSVPLRALVAEAARLFHECGVREVTLLGQNVTSWVDWSGAGGGPAVAAARAAARADPAAAAAAAYAPGFTSALLPIRGLAAGGGTAATFPDLVAAVAAVSPELRVRFSSPHPRDFTPRLIATLAATPNAARALHLPAQSGSTAVLARMGRGYTRHAYDALVAAVRAALPRVGLSTDVIVGFCGEGAADHAATLDLLRTVRYDNAFLFAYSPRPRTKAARVWADDVPAGVKSSRLVEAVEVYRAALAEKSGEEVGRTHLVLVEGAARRRGDGGGGGGGSTEAGPPLLKGLTSTGRRVLFPEAPGGGLTPGTYAAVRVTTGLPGSLRGEVVRVTTAADWFQRHGGAAWAEGGEDGGGGGSERRAA